LDNQTLEFIFIHFFCITL